MTIPDGDFDSTLEHIRGAWQGWSTSSEVPQDDELLRIAYWHIGVVAKFVRQARMEAFEEAAAICKEIATRMEGEDGMKGDFEAYSSAGLLKWAAHCIRGRISDEQG